MLRHILIWRIAKVLVLVALALGAITYYVVSQPSGHEPQHCDQIDGCS